MRWRGQLTAGLMLLVTFSVGALCGMAAEEAFGLDWFDFFEEARDDRADRLLAGLNLTHEQRARTDEIMERHEDQLEDYWEGRLPEIQRLLQQSYAEIRTALTPAQQAAFDDRLRNLDGRVPAELRDD